MADWQNRIVEFGVKKADQFTANPANPRIHPQFQRDVMEAALNDLGWIAPVIENSRTGYLVDGHERVMASLKDNQDVPYVVVDISPEEEQYALATFDTIGSLAQYEQQKLDELLQDVKSDSDAVQQMLADLAAENDLYLPDGFQEFDESIEDSVEYITCPHCGEQFPK